jgi:translation initiation factor 6
MKIKRLKIMGSNYLGLFGITNDTLCFLPNNTEEESIKVVENTLDVKVVTTNLYESALLAVFAKMNNKKAYLPEYFLPKEIESIEKEIKVKLIKTDHALGNMLELNDTHAIVSESLEKTELKLFEKEGLEILQTNLARTNAIGSAIAITNKSFVINPNSSNEEIKKVQKFLGFSGGASTANTGDAFIRNSVLANKNGFVIGEATTGHEINRIDEALEG